MIKRHRKLFPINGTECSDFCGDPYAQFYYLSPPPPSAPSPLLVPPPSQNDGGQSNGVSPPVIVLFSLLSCFCLLLLYYVVVSKSCLGFCKRRPNHEDDLIASSSSSQSDGGGDLGNRAAAAAAVDHPIWLITTVGLQQAIINSITAVRYRKSEGLIEGTDCTVCLGEFREGETVRLLPKCSHAFHVACIDAWLRSHTNCPLCRANIVTTTTTTRSSAEVNRSGSRGSLDNSSGQNDIVMNGLVEEEEEETIVENSSEIESNDTNRGFEENDMARLVRRSVSMDHIKASGDQKREDKFSKLVRLSPVPMKKRSLSCGGIKFFSSRQNDN